MVMKAGASNHDKHLIRKMHQNGQPADIISATLKIRQKQVTAIIEQIKAGTLTIGGTGQGQPLPGDADGQIQALEPGAAQAVLEEQSEAEIKAANERAEEAESENEALREQLANMEAVLEQQTAPDPENPPVSEEDAEETTEEE